MKKYTEHNLDYSETAFTFIIVITWCAIALFYLCYFLTYLRAEVNCKCGSYHEFGCLFLALNYMVGQRFQMNLLPRHQG